MRSATPDRCAVQLLQLQTMCFRNSRLRAGFAEAALKPCAAQMSKHQLDILTVADPLHSRPVVTYSVVLTASEVALSTLADVETDDAPACQLD
jgi:hypothetical protein